MPVAPEAISHNKFWLYLELMQGLEVNYSSNILANEFEHNYGVEWFQRYFMWILIAVFRCWVTGFLTGALAGVWRGAQPALPGRARGHGGCARDTFPCDWGPWGHQDGQERGAGLGPAWGWWAVSPHRQVWGCPALSPVKRGGIQHKGLGDQGRGFSGSWKTH